MQSPESFKGALLWPIVFNTANGPTLARSMVPPCLLHLIARHDESTQMTRTPPPSRADFRTFRSLQTRWADNETYGIGLFRNDEETAFADGRFVHVYVDRDTRRPQQLPETWRATLGEIA